MTDGRLGMIATPAQHNRIPAGAIWCADNGCYGDRYVGDAEWFGWLATRPHRDRCRFATAPDVVGDAAATLARSLPWLPLIRDLGYPAAFVAQDGLTVDAAPWDDLDVLFVGGSTAWKLGGAARALVAAARARGKSAHMGRVNSRNRYRYAEHIGCDSVDGTYLTFGPDVNLPVLLGWGATPPLFGGST